MKKAARIVLGQINAVVGDIAGNAAKMVSIARRARETHHADLVVFPELALTGYPPEDLLLRTDFIERVSRGMEQLREASTTIDIVFGYPHRAGAKLYNAACWLHQGKQSATYFKQCLPNYGVFDEKRYFSAGQLSCVHTLNDIPIGVLICEDMWEDAPMRQVTKAGAKVALIINASPYDYRKPATRMMLARKHTATNQIPLAYLNIVGGQDELIFDGQSFAIDREGKVVMQAEAFTEGEYVIDIDGNGEVQLHSKTLVAPIAQEEEIYRALVLSVRDYVDKNRFPGVVLGLSGGVDSALTATVAVDALGAERVQAVLMPSRYTSSISINDAKAVSEALGIQYSEISIEPVFEAYLKSLVGEFKNLPPDKTEENIQARIRGMLLMAISNKTGKLVLTTGNKSEMAVGYATLYGDMAGGFAVLKDVSKTWVYRLVKYRNDIKPVVPARVIERAPSAELAPNQKDSDSLPPYEVLDPILERYIEHDLSAQGIIDEGYNAEDVERVTRMVDHNEYKRRQSPPGVRITPRAFGRERRYPITVVMPRAK